VASEKALLSDTFFALILFDQADSGTFYPDNILAALRVIFFCPSAAVEPLDSTKKQEA